MFHPLKGIFGLVLMAVVLIHFGRPQPDPKVILPQAEYHPLAGVRYQFTFTRDLKISSNQSLYFPPVGFSGIFWVEVAKANLQGFDARVGIIPQGQSSSSSPALAIHWSTQADHLSIPLTILLGVDAQSSNSPLLSILKDLLAQWAFFLNRDTLGEFEANYQLSSVVGDRAVVVKTKRAYHLNVEAGPVPKILASHHVLIWSQSENMPLEIVGSETTAFQKGEFELMAQSAYRFHWIGSEAIAGEQVRAQIAKFNQTEMLGVSAKPRSNHVGHVSMIEEILRSGRVNAGGSLNIFGEFVQSLRDDNTQVKNILSLLKEEKILGQGARNPLFRMVIGALASLNTSAAQAALIATYQDPECPLDGKKLILASLTISQAASRRPQEGETREFLMETFECEPTAELQQAAGFALGASLRMASTDDAQIAKAIHKIENHWEIAKALDDLPSELAIIGAMGNSGQSEYLEILRQQAKEAQGPNESLLRAKAIYALRFIPAEAASTLLNQSLLDVDPRVRRAAGEGLRARKRFSALDSFESPE